MKTFKQIRETMTEQALSIECVMRGYAQVDLQQLASACQLNEPMVEFILAQMESVSMVKRAELGGYALTAEYLGAKLV